MTYNMKLTEEPLIDIRDAFRNSYSKALEDQGDPLSADMGAKSFDKFKKISLIKS